MYKIGVDIGGTKIAYGLFNEDVLVDKIVVKSRSDLENEEFFNAVIDDINAFINKNNVGLKELKGIGIGMPSFIVFNDGFLVKTVNLTKIKNFAAKEYMEKILGVKVVFDNDTHVAALAEHRLGAGKGKTNMVYCAVSTGIASGIIINNQLFRGSYGWAGETGHMLFTPHKGVLCGCGHRGCFMSYTSGSMIVKHIKEHINNGEKTIMMDLAGGAENITARHILQAYNAGDALAVSAVNQMAEGLAVWLYNLYQCLNINCYVFGGGLVNFGDILFKKVREEFDRLNLDPYPVEFKFAELKDDFGIIGASLLID